MTKADVKIMRYIRIFNVISEINLNSIVRPKKDPLWVFGYYGREYLMLRSPFAVFCRLMPFPVCFKVGMT